MHPNINESIGLTWSPGYPKNSFDSWDIHDRIDMIYYKNGNLSNLHLLESYIYDCDPWPSDHRSVITEFSLCKNADLGDFNFDGMLNVLDITILVNELLYSSNQYCIYLYGDFDNNQDLNVLDVIQLVNIILA